MGETLHKYTAGSHSTGQQNTESTSLINLIFPATVDMKEMPFEENKRLRRHQISDHNPALETNGVEE